MSLDLEIQEGENHLAVKASGRYSFANLFELFARVKAESERHNRTGVILDVTRVAGTIPIMEMFLLGDHCSKIWGPPFRIAILPLEEWVYKFMENVARNRGVQVAVVTHPTAAMEWVTLQQ